MTSEVDGMSEQGLMRRELSTQVLIASVPEPGVRAPEGRAHRIPKIRGRAQEIAAMTTWRRWQDWVVVALGVILFVTPFVFGETSQAVAASAAYVLGVLIVLGGLLNAAMRQAGGLEIIPAVLAVILFVSPWAFGFTAVTALAWSAWITAILIVLAVGSLFAMQTRRATA
jgi:SPW repeat-containing protein